MEHYTANRQPPTPLILDLFLKNACFSAYPIITSRHQICEVFSDLLQLSMSLTDDNCLPFIWRFFRKFVRFASKRQYIESSLTVNETVHRILWMWMFWNLELPTFLPYLPIQWRAKNKWKCQISFGNQQKDFNLLTLRLLPRRWLI